MRRFQTERGRGTRGGLTRRRFVQGTAATAALAATGCQSTQSPNTISATAPGKGAPPSSDTLEAARAIIEKYPTFDMHTHAGRLHSSKGNLDDTRQAMNEGGLTAFCFSPVADGAVLRNTNEGLRVIRQPHPGELYSNTYARLQTAKSQFEKHDLIPILGPADARTAKAGGRLGVLIAIEGGDFLEGRLERVAEAHRRGVRSIQLVHYRINELGDIQTEPSKHGGLTPFGRRVVGEMNRLGMIIDVAHLTFKGTRAVAEASDKPFMLSHSTLGQGGRTISNDHARIVAAGGGVIGVFAAGERTLDGYIDRFRRLADVVGAEHVGLGSDMGSGGPFYVFSSHAKLPALAQGLLRRGLGEEEVAGILGGNFLRLFEAVSATPAA